MKIGQTVRSVQVRKEVKKVTGGAVGMGWGVKIETDDDKFTHMQNRALKDRNNKVCMWGEVPDVITAIKFDVDRFRGFRSQGLQIGVFH